MFKSKYPLNPEKSVLNCLAQNATAAFSVFTSLSVHLLA